MALASPMDSNMYLAIVVEAMFKGIVASRRLRLVSHVVCAVTRTCNDYGKGKFNTAGDKELVVVLSIVANKVQLVAVAMAVHFVIANANGQDFHKEGLAYKAARADLEFSTGQQLRRVVRTSSSAKHQPRKDDGAYYKLHG